MTAPPISSNADSTDRMVAMNEALMLGALKQHELAEAAETLNALLRREIAERKQVEEALKTAQAGLKDRAVHLGSLVAERTRELTVTNAQLEDFVYSIAHDLRGPLRSMQGFAAALSEDTDAGLSETGRDFAERISRSAQHMDALLYGLLAFSRVAQQEIELFPADLEVIVRTVVTGLEMEHPHPTGCIDMVGPWPHVLAHKPMLVQILENLLGNSLKFTSENVKPKVRLHTEDRGQFVRVRVDDDGIGVLPEHREQIFRLFSKLHGDAYQGIGIGLALVRKSAERMGGSAGVESLPGGGSRFWFELKKSEEAP